MQLKRILTAILCLLWGGCFFLFPASSEAVSLTDRYPQTISGDYMADIAHAKVVQELQDKQETRRQDIQLVRKPRDMRVPAGQLICEVHLPSGISYTGQTPVYVEAYVNGVFYRRAILYYRVRIYGNVVVAAHDLRLEQALGPSDGTIQERCIEDAGAVYLTDLKQLEGHVPARAIHGGTVLTPAMLTTPAVMQSGSPITLIMRTGAIEVKTDGFAMQKGRIGARIRVRNAKSGKMLRGKVIDANTVEIEG